MGLSHTVSGDIASFRTPSRVPIESLKFHFLPKQAAGTPSPENPILIEGWTGLNGGGHGINLWDEEWELGTFNNEDGEKNPSSNCIRSKNYIPCKPNTSYYLRHPIQSNDCHLYFYGKNKEFIDHIWKWPGSFTTPSNCYYIRFYMYSSYGATYLNNIGINYPSSKTSYVKYTGNKEIPITFPNGEIIYGGYIDPVAGEIVATFKKINLKNRAWYFYTGNQFALNTDKKLLSDKVFCDMLPISKINGYPTDDKSIGFWGNGASYSNIIFIKYEASNDVNDFKTWLNSLESDPYLIYELVTPIHIPIATQDFKAFLDYNNFWSDANDITEVTYAVTESKDILATRKKAMDFDHAHHKKVKWNQLQMDGNFTDSSKWEVGNNYGTRSLSNNIGTWTCTTQPTQFYQTGIRIKNGTDNSNFLSIPWNHKVLVRCFAKCSVATSVRIYGLVSTTGNGYTYSYSHGDMNLTANEWTKICGFISNRPETPPSGLNDTIIKRFKLCIRGANATISTITVGTTLEMKNFMAFDLTEMFGLGNEPSTVEEFEHVCEINGIDLDTYQPYDTGSDRWLIIP